MKKSFIAVLSALAILSTSCLSGLGGGNTSTNTGGLLGNVLGAVLGNVLGLGFTANGLQGNWSYSAPSAAFTSQQALLKAGGDAAANNLVSSLAPNYKEIGITKNNTYFNFGANNSFIAKVNGIPFNGTYTYNEQNGEITLKSGTQTIKGNVTKTANGIGLMFDSNQMVNMLQKVGQVTDATALEAVKNLAKSANGASVGFELVQ